KLVGGVVATTKAEKVEPLDMKLEVVDLIARGVGVSEVFHYAGGVFGAGGNARVGGRDPQGRSYFSFASFADPDGNGWLLQEIKERLPGREWKERRGQAMDVATLAELLRETEE